MAITAINFRALAETRRGVNDTTNNSMKEKQTFKEIYKEDLKYLNGVGFSSVKASRFWW